MANRRTDQAVYSDEQRAEALELAAEHGPAEAARRTGIPGATVRSWLHREGRSGPGLGADPEAWLAERERSARASLEVVAKGIDQAKRHLAAGEASKAQSAMTTAAIASDKADQMLRAVEEQRARTVRIAEDQGELIAAVLGAVFADLGVSAPVGLMKHYLAQAGDGTVVGGSAAGVPEARAALRREVLRGVTDEQLRGELEARDRGGPAALPAGQPVRVGVPEPVDVVDEGADDQAPVPHRSTRDVLGRSGFRSDDGQVWT